MKTYRVVDDRGEQFRYDATDMRMALVVHHELRGTDPVLAEEERE